MLYNQTSLANVTNAFDLITYANNSTDGLMAGLFVIAIFFVLVMNLLKYEPDKMNALGVASFITFILSFLFFTIKLMSLYWMLAFLVLTLVFLTIGWLRNS